MSPPGSPPVNNFTVTFEKPGTYSYLCNVHPWMTGSVTVNWQRHSQVTHSTKSKIGIYFSFLLDFGYILNLTSA